MDVLYCSKIVLNARVMKLGRHATLRTLCSKSVGVRIPPRAQNLMGEWDCMGWSSHLQCEIQRGSLPRFSTRAKGMHMNGNPLQGAGSIPAWSTNTPSSFEP